MANLRITRLGHGGVLYRSPEDAWVWVDRWTGAPTYADAYRTAEKVSVVAPTHIAKSAHGRKRKTDLRDAKRLWDVLVAHGEPVVGGAHEQMRAFAEG